MGTDLGTGRYGSTRTCMFPGEVVVIIMSCRCEVRSPEASQPTGAFCGACLMLRSGRGDAVVVCPSYGAQARGCGRHFPGWLRQVGGWLQLEGCVFWGGSCNFLQFRISQLLQ